MKTVFHFISLFLVVSFLTQLSAQENSYTQEQISVEIPIVESITPMGVPSFSQSRKNTHGANFQVSLRVKDLTQFLTNMPAGENLEVKLNIVAVDASNNPVSNVTENPISLNIDNNNYQNVYFVDLINQLDPNYELVIKEFQITVTDVNGATGISDYLDLSATCIVDYGYDVTTDGKVPVSGVENMKVNVTAQKKEVKFSWDNTYPFSYYEIQLWKDPTKHDDSQYLDVNPVTPMWDKALSVLVPVSPYEDGLVTTTKSYALSIIEGSGVYVWRVRPVGGFYANSFAEIKNFGQWPVGLTGGPITLSYGNENIQWFRFTAPDEKINSIQSKIYTEDGKTKEIVTYADGLQNVKQTQTYLPSEATTIIAQTEQDFSGRPSLTSIPVPVDGRPDSYHQKLLQNDVDQVYTAKDFDKEVNGNVKTNVAGSNGAFKYYVNNADKRIPNSDGYPFIRTLYYNDGSGRVKEQSAPGITFAMNSADNIHTVKYYYGIPSENELTRVFGKDAPNHEKVMKSVVVDQNGVATVSYTTMEGNVIATCISLSDNDLNNLEPIDAHLGTALIDVVDKTTTSAKTEYGFYSSKRLILTQETLVAIGYSVSKPELDAGCTKANVDCKFNLELSYINLSTGQQVILYPVKDVDIPFSEISFTGNVKKIEDKIVTLPAGSYLIQKKLIPGEYTVDVNREILANKIVPLSKLLERWMDLVMCNTDAEKYYLSLNILKNHFDNGTLDILASALTSASLFEVPDNIGWSSFLMEYNKLPLDEKKLYTINFFDINENGQDIPVTGPLSNDKIPDYAYIRTACCELTCGTKYAPYITFDPATWGFNGTTYNPDFEKFAIDYLAGCFGSGHENDFYTYYMNGWAPGTFNLMIYHMLMDEYPKSNPYNASSNVKNASSNVASDFCGQLLKNQCTDNKMCKDVHGDCSQEACFNYNIYDLFNCWKGVLTKLQTDLGCASIEADGYGVGDDAGQKVVTLIDQNNTDPEDPSFDEHFNENFKGKGLKSRVIKFLAKMGLPKRMRDDSPTVEDESANQAPGYSTMHLVKEFLECTGYKFAKILTPYEPFPLSNTDPAKSDRVPNKDYLYVQVNNNPDDVHPTLLSGGVSMSVYTSTYKKGTDYYYVPLNDWKPTKFKFKEEKDGLLATTEALFPNIKNPIFAFKYFVYEGHARTEYAGLEARTCFEDPNDCYKTGSDGKILNGIDGREKVPCCEESGGIDEFCYRDHKYPLLSGLSANQIATDKRYGQDEDGRYKNVVREFTDAGRISCPYDHTAWSSGERYTFYLSLTNMGTPLLMEGEVIETTSETCLSIKNDEIIWFRSPSGDLVADDMRPIDATGYNRIWDMTPYELVDHGEGEIPVLTKIEVEMAQVKNKCLTGCENNLDLMREAVLEALEKNCYDIGGCYTLDSRWNIPSSHVDKMVEALYTECKNKCTVTSFACEDIVDHRDINTEKSDIGPVSVIEEGYSNVFIGLAHEPSFEIDEIRGEYICDQSPLMAKPYVDCDPYMLYTEIDLCASVTGPNIYQWNISSYDMEDYSWYEYTQIQQATNWQVEISLEPMCHERWPEMDNPLSFEGTVGKTSFVDTDEYEVPVTVPDAERIPLDKQVISPVRALPTITITPQNP